MGERTAHAVHVHGLRRPPGGASRAPRRRGAQSAERRLRPDHEVKFSRYFRDSWTEVS